MGKSDKKSKGVKSGLLGFPGNKPIIPPQQTWGVGGRPRGPLSSPGPQDCPYPNVGVTEHTDHPSPYPQITEDLSQPSGSAGGFTLPYGLQAQVDIPVPHQAPYPPV